MRAIKFRAWTGKKIISRDVLKNLKTIMLSSVLEWVHRDYIPMQFTGLRDKNGKEIYEGDILESTRPAKEKYLVFWDKEDAAFYGRHELFESRFRMSDILNCVIVGNIHENPELINR